MSFRLVSRARPTLAAAPSPEAPATSATPEPAKPTHPLATSLEQFLCGRDGCPACFRVFMDDWTAIARDRVRPALRNSADAEDVVQEVLMRIFRKAHSFDPAKGELPNWINTIITNEIRTAGKRDKKNRERNTFFSDMANEEHLDLVSPAMAPDRYTERRDLLQKSKVATKGVAVRFKKAAIRHHLKGATYEQVGEQVGQNPGTIKTQCHRLGKALKAHPLAEAIKEGLLEEIATPTK